ncbi:hypothetical protein [Vibrio parahaemolyticus]|uniref:hypothetical protein n=1 Tax=Vibrio parahaemolyticus TaxID=670 RepID=UPI0012AD5052|nr:hypothetical protein [Vibrio parahaemolyticus]
MLEQYSLSEYQNDVAAAHEKYTEIVRAHCVSQFGIVPLSDQDIYEVKASANGYKNQLLSAAGKRLRAAITLRLLDQLSEQFDLTFTLAVHISKELLGRAINRKILLDRYSTQFRTAANKSVDIARLSLITKTQAFINAKADLESTLAKAETIRFIERDRAYQDGKGEAFKLLSQSAKQFNKIR